MRAALLVLSCSVALVAQPPDQASLVRLTRELETAIQHGSLESAAEISTRLNDGVQAQESAWLIRDAHERVGEVLSWLPTDTESIWVNQDPFEIRGDESLQMLYGRPVQSYSLDWLAALNDGSFYRSLSHRTVRFVVAATRGIQRPQSDTVAVPGVMPAQDVVYFYFFSQPVELPSPDESDHGRPVWQASAKILAGNSFEPGVEPPKRDDNNWIALARPDLLILTNRRELLAEVLGRISLGSKMRALPVSLPEWAQTDQTAPFWGLRHYTGQSKPKPGDRGCTAAQLPQPDCGATGVTVRFDPATQRVEIRYLSENQPEQRYRLMRREFLVEQAEAGVFRLTSDAQKRGPFPVIFAIQMLGFGGYR